MTAITALMCFVVWTILLALSYATYRVPMILTGSRKASHWERNGGQTNDDPPILQRAKGAHLNCVENLPLFAAVVLAGLATNQAAVVDGVAAYVFYARVVQSVMHLIGQSFIFIAVRATFFLIQLALILYMAFSLIG